MSTASVAHTRELVLRHGWNSTSFQLVNPGLERWLADDHDAVVGFVRKSGVRVVAGAPVCSAAELPGVIEQFESEARSMGETVVYFGAAGRLEQILRKSERHSVVTLGAQPVWDPQAWQHAFELSASLRAQLHRATNKGVTVEEWPAERSRGNPELQRCLTEWLDTRGLPPLHFLVEPQTLAQPEGRRVFVGMRNGHPIGFVVLSPVPKRNGWLTEQFVRGKAAPNGAVELMLDLAVRTVAAEGASYLTMGLVPLSRHTPKSWNHNPVWLRLLLGWVRAHGRRFYNFDGLDAFKAKFQPSSWEPIYAASNEPRFSFRSLYAIAAAFTEGPPPVALLRGMGKALRQELRWLFRR